MDSQVASRHVRQPADALPAAASSVLTAVRTLAPPDIPITATRFDPTTQPSAPGTTRVQWADQIRQHNLPPDQIQAMCYVREQATVTTQPFGRERQPDRQQRADPIRRLGLRQPLDLPHKQTADRIQPQDQQQHADRQRPVPTTAMYVRPTVTGRLITTITPTMRLTPHEEAQRVAARTPEATDL